MLQARFERLVRGVTSRCRAAPPPLKKPVSHMLDPSAPAQHPDTAPCQPSQLRRTLVATQLSVSGASILGHKTITTSPKILITAALLLLSVQSATTIAQRSTYVNCPRFYESGILSPASDPISSLSDPRLAPYRARALAHFATTCPELIYVGSREYFDTCKEVSGTQDKTCTYWNYGYGSSPISAILGGGQVVGTECVNGKVDPEAINLGNSMSFGPDQTLYMKSSGSINLRSTEDYTFRSGDEVYSLNIENGFDNGQKDGNSLVKANCDQGNISFFSTDNSCTNGSLPYGAGAGTHLLMFKSQDGPEVILGRMYKTTPTTGYPVSYSCSPPGLVPPDEPTILRVEAHASGGMFLEFVQDGPGGDPDYYLYEMLHQGGIETRQGTVVDAQGNNDTSSPFVIIPQVALSQTPGQWKIRIQAWNAAGGSPWSAYSELITPSIDAPPLPGQPLIDEVTPGNGTAIISFNAPDDNGLAISNYAYSLSRDIAETNEFLPFAPPTTTSPFTLTGLNNGETYTVSIRAMNANGMGPDSNVVKFTLSLRFLVPVPIPYWVLGFLTGLMGWLGYRRLRAA